LGVGKHSTFTIMKELHFTPSGTLVLSILLATHALRVSIDLTIRLWAIKAIVYKMWPEVFGDADAPMRELITRVWEFSTPFKLVRPPN